MYIVDLYSGSQYPYIGLFLITLPYFYVGSSGQWSDPVGAWRCRAEALRCRAPRVASLQGKTMNMLATSKREWGVGDDGSVRARARDQHALIHACRR